MVYAVLLLLVGPDRLAPGHRVAVGRGCVVSVWRNPITGRDDLVHGHLDALGHPACP